MTTLAKTECGECCAEYTLDESAITLYVDPPYAACLRCFLSSLTVPELEILHHEAIMLVNICRQYGLDIDHARRVVLCAISARRGNRGHHTSASLECLYCRLDHELSKPDGGLKELTLYKVDRLAEEYGVSRLEVFSTLVTLPGWYHHPNPR